MCNTVVTIPVTYDIYRTQFKAVSEHTQVFALEISHEFPDQAVVAVITTDVAPHATQ